MRHVAIHVSLAIMVSLSLAGCSSKQQLSPEMQIKQAQLSKLQFTYMLSECTVADQINQNRRTTKPAEVTIPQDDCNYFRSKGKAEGYMPMSSKIPSLSINGIPLPFHEMKLLQEGMQTRANSQRASNAQVPAAISAKGDGATTVYRNLVYRGFREDEVNKIINSSGFQQAVANYNAVQAYRFD